MIDPNALVLVTVILAFGIAAISLCVVFVTIVAIPFNAKPGAVRGWLRLNPLNVVLYTDRLTAKGRSLRKMLLIALATFFFAIFVGGLCSLAMKLSQG